MTKPTKLLMYPAKTQISLGICPVWSGCSLSAWRNIGPLTTYCAHSEDWFESSLRAHVILLVLLCGGSNVNGCSVWTENCIIRVAVLHHMACRVVPNSYPITSWDRIFNWHSMKSLYFGFKCRHVKFLEKKLVTTRAMTSFSEQGARTECAKENRIWEY